MKAFIPAHGYSRRVYRKHTKLMCGHPLTAWSIVQALNSKYVDTVYVSTDDDEVARVVEKYGGTVVWREYEQHPDDGAGVPLYHALKSIPITDEFFVNMLATSPLRLPGMIDRMVEMQRPEMMNLLALGLARETYVYKRLPEDTCKLVIGAKDYSYLFMSNSTAITNVQYTLNTFEWSMAHGLDKDAVADEYAAKVDRGEVKAESYEAEHDIKQYYFPVEAWQCWEPDNLQDFAVCEALLETMILKGRSMEDVYGAD